MIADGRFHLLSALSLAHHAARLGAEAPFVLLVADDEQVARLAEVDEGELHGFVPLPLTASALANALQALPLDAPPPRPRSEPAPRPAVPAPATRSTRLPRRPRRARHRAASRRPPRSRSGSRRSRHTRNSRRRSRRRSIPRVVDGLRALGGGPGFLREVIESFRADARQIMERLYQAAATADPTAFARGLIALHRASGQLGGAELCELAASLQRVTASELRQHGAAHVQRLDAEIDRLAAALMEYLPASEARR